MKPANFAPAYVSLYPALCEIARSHGYALTIHGTVGRDFDLVAVPWRDENVSPAEALMQEIAERAHAIYDVFGTGIVGPEPKPHGRVAWSIMIGSGSMIDLSVMPVVRAAASIGQGGEVNAD